jgi:hypothetical protein
VSVFLPIQEHGTDAHDGNPDNGHFNRTLFQDKGITMNSNQRSEANNQTNNGGNELAESSSRAFSTAKRADQDQTPTPGAQPPRGGSMQQAGAGDSAPSVDRAGSQTGSVGQGLPAGHESNDAAGGMPKSPGGANQLAADRKMDDDSGLSNTANRAATGLDEGIRQEQQSNVGRRSDGTPD